MSYVTRETRGRACVRTERNSGVQPLVTAYGVGELGKPFTETEDDEEWVGWVDWGTLGGGSGSGSA